MVATCGIGWGDGLSFIGALVGAGAGIAAAFLAVARQQSSTQASNEKTIRQLIARLRGTAEEVRRLGVRDAETAMQKVFNALWALRDTAVGMRTASASLATIASLMTHTTVWKTLDRNWESLQFSGPKMHELIDLAEEIDDLCSNLVAELHVYDD